MSIFSPKYFENTEAESTIPGYRSPFSRAFTITNAVHRMKIPPRGLLHNASMTRLFPWRRWALGSVLAVAVSLGGVSALSGQGAQTNDHNQASTIRAAFENGDDQQIAIEARSLSAKAYAELLSSNRRTRIAAALALSTREDAVEFLDALALAAESPDRVVSVVAARAAHQVTAQLNHTLIAEREITRSELGGALSKWHALARNPQRRIDVRVVALEISQRIANHLADKPGAAVVELIADDDPQMRTAAFELLPAPLPAPHQARVVAALNNETDDYATIAAASALCGGVDFGDDASARSKLTLQARANLAKLLGSKRMSASARLDASFCLVGSPLWTATARKALVKSLPNPLAKLVPPLVPERSGR